MTATLAPERALGAARIAGGLGTIGLLVNSIVGAPSGPTLLHVIATVACGALWMATYLVEEPRSVVYGSAIFLLLNTAIVIGLWSSTQRIAESGINWVPFRAQQLGAITVALLAPPVVWVGVAAIAGTIGASVAQFMLFEPAIRAHLPFGDPWSTLFFGGFALGLYWYRLRADRRDRDIIQAEAETESYQRFARAMIAIRDMSNTPLQTLINMVQLLRVRCPELGDTADRLERAVARLTELERATRPFERQLAWKKGDESWDPKAILQTESPRPS